MRRAIVIIGALFACVHPAHAAIALVQNPASNATGSGISIAVTFGAGVTAGNVIWVAARGSNETHTFTPTMTNVTFTAAVGPTSHSSGSVNIRMYLWCGQVDTGGETSLTVTSSGSTALSAVAAEFSGTGTCAAAIDKTGSGETASAGTAHDITGTLTTTTANELLIGACAFSGAAGTTTPGASYTEFDTNDTDVRPDAQYRIVSATGSYSAPETTANSVDSVCLMATQAESGAVVGTRHMLIGSGVF